MDMILGKIKFANSFPWLFNKMNFQHNFLVSKLSTNFIDSMKSACRNGQVVMQFVMHLDDNNRFPTYLMPMTAQIEMFHWGILLDW